MVGTLHLPFLFNFDEYISVNVSPVLSSILLLKPPDLDEVKNTSEYSPLPNEGEKSLNLELISGINST